MEKNQKNAKTSSQIALFSSITAIESLKWVKRLYKLGCELVYDSTSDSQRYMAKRPKVRQNKSLYKILYPKFFFQLAKGDEFSRCQYVTPDGRTFISVKNGQEVVDEDNNIVTGVEALLEIDNLPVCGLKLTNFTSNYFGWWSCEMGNNDPKYIFHKGTFKINKPNEWPTEIRLPTDVKVSISNSSYGFANSFLTAILSSLRNCVFFLFLQFRFHSISFFLIGISLLLDFLSDI
jgi:hypothetical protein